MSGTRAAPNWEKTGTIAGYAKYLREKSGALAVIVIRVNDAVAALDDELPAKELATLIETRLPELMADVSQARAEKRPPRLRWEDLRE